MESKKCKKCLFLLPNNNFSKNKQSKDGLQSKCKKCSKLYYENNILKISEQLKQYRKKNVEYFKNYRKNINWDKYILDKESIKKSKKLYYQKNKSSIRNKSKIYYQKNKASIRDKSKIYRKNKKTELNTYNKNYIKNRRVNDSLYKIKSNIRSLICNALKKHEYIKKSKVSEILDCSFKQFKHHLEAQFEPWMNWDNYGNPKDGIFELNKTWDIDHIIPLDTAITEDDVIRLNHYSNLQPLCSYYNRWIKKNINKNQIYDL